MLLMITKINFYGDKMSHFAKTFFTYTDSFYNAEKDELSAAFYEKLPLVSEERRARIERARNNATKAELLCAELLRDHALSEVFGIKDVKVTLNEYEKPYLTDHPDKFFNLSHSGRAIVCTVSDVECGVDVENASRPHDLMGIAGRFFSTMEQSAVMMSPNPTEAFCRLWTIRESYVKMRGTGFSMGLKALRCDFHRGKASMIENNVPKTDAFFDEFKHIYGYRACICTKEPVEHEVKKVDLV